MRKRLGDILQIRGLLSDEQLATALAEQRKTGDRLGQALIKLGYVTADEVVDALSEHLNIARADFARRYIDPGAVDLIPANMVTNEHVLPLEMEDGYLTVAMCDPLNINIIDDLQRITGKTIKPVLATEEEINDAFQRTRNIAQSAKEVFDRFREDEKDKDGSLEEQRQFIGDAPGVRLANMILEQAIKQKASDVHFEPHEEGMRVRFRIDGILRVIMEIPKHLQGDVNSRVRKAGF
ncbi:MAG TPA: hypothetical protein GX521_05145 [Firmicutes bacterium]|nr:hypothetical protein [Bacillota bacterium]